MAGKHIRIIVKGKCIEVGKNFVRVTQTWGSNDSLRATHKKRERKAVNHLTSWRYSVLLILYLSQMLFPSLFSDFPLKNFPFLPPLSLILSIFLSLCYFFCLVRPFLSVPCLPEIFIFFFSSHARSLAIHLLSRLQSFFHSHIKFFSLRPLLIASWCALQYAHLFYIRGEPVFSLFN